jgi:uncharacterized surface protein with fasciclin (FAS1) repeats
MYKSLLGATLAVAFTSTVASAANIVETAAVFAPTDEAFAKLPAGTVDSLLKPENKDKLAAILTYHVLPRKLTSNQMLEGPFHVRTLKAEGDRLLAVSKGATVTVDNATVVKADIMADNGVIHVIDTVMLPES